MNPPRDRTRARQLAAQSLSHGDPTGWFEQLYREAESGRTVVPWVNRRPTSMLLDFRERLPPGGSALQIGCGLGDDAEQLAAWGFETTAFDVSESAIRACRARFPASTVRYETADLLAPPEAWKGAFDLVFECNTLQVLRPPWREQAIRHTAAFVRDGGRLLVIARSRNEGEPEGEMPWPLTRGELHAFEHLGLRVLSFEEIYDDETPPVRRFRALYGK